MSMESDLRFLGAGPSVVAALGVLPPAFAEAFAAEARRLVETENTPERPATPPGFFLPPPASTSPRPFPSGLEHPATLRFHLVVEIMRGSAGRLLATCNAFRLVLAAWREWRGVDLVPDSPDCPPLRSRPWDDAENARIEREDWALVKSLAAVPDEVQTIFEETARRFGYDPARDF